MSWNNRWILSALSKAKKAGDAEEHARLSRLFDETQDRCAAKGHPGPEGKQVFRPKDLAAIKKEEVRKKYAVGGTLRWCLLCGKKTGYDPPGGQDGVSKEG